MSQRDLAVFICIIPLPKIFFEGACIPNALNLVDCLPSSGSGTSIDFIFPTHPLAFESMQQWEVQKRQQQGENLVITEGMPALASNCSKSVITEGMPALASNCSKSMSAPKYCPTFF